MLQTEPRERAARALCRLHGQPENATSEGQPVWRSFLPQVDVVLQAVLPPEECERLRKSTPHEPRFVLRQ
jgi:hypothetical protein